MARVNFDLVIDPYPFPSLAESEAPECCCEVLHEEILAGIVGREVWRDATKQQVRQSPLVGNVRADTTQPTGAGHEKHARWGDRRLQRGGRT